MTAALALAPVESPTPAEVDSLVRTNLPLVGYLVRELIHRLPAHISRDDLYSAGMYALTLAAQGFDASRGVPFPRFATIRIRGALTDELRAMDWASRGVRGRARELDTTRGELATALGRTPTRTEVATAMGVSIADVDSVDADVRRASVLSLQALTPDTADDVLPVATDGPESVLLKREQLGYLHDAVEVLPERLRAVVRQYFFEGRTMIQIAAELGVTESRVSQLRAEALTLLRAGLQSVDDDPADAAPVKGRRAAGRAAYCSAVATRSSVTGRLAVTTVLGEIPEAPAAQTFRAQLRLV